jgi:signal transduction histidine kinase
MINTLLLTDNPAEKSSFEQDLKIYEELAYIQAYDLTQAVHCLQDQKFDLILLDTAPDIASLNTILVLHKQAPKIPIIVITNQEDQALALQFLRAGVQDYLVKGSYTKESLWRAILYAIERHRLEVSLQQHSEMLEVANRHLAQKTEELAQEIQTRKKLELELQVAQAENLKSLEKERELNQLRSRFITMTSHEFRTPLTTILGSAQLLKNRSSKWSEEKKLTYFNQIEATILHMTQMLDDILLINQAESAKLTFHPSPSHLIEFCQSLLSASHLQEAERARIVLNVEGECFGPDKKLPLVDIKLLECILMNLLTNALKYSTPHTPIQLSLKCDQERAIFQVEDQGIGIPKEEQLQLFQPFHRAKNVGKIAGTGLGLAVTKRCVELHQGEISFTSKEGYGATFTVNIPLVFA